MNNIKVAYICHFSTPLIRSRAKLKSLWLGNLLRKVKGLPKLKYCDAGTWNEDFIKAFENRSDFECHVILPHLGLKSKKQIFSINGVQYVLLREKENLYKKIGKYLLHIADKENYGYYARLIKHEVDSINPDVIVVCGAENPIYSSSVLLIHNKPIFVILQTWLNSPKRIEMGVGNEERRNIENNIFEHACYYGTFEVDVARYIRMKNENATFFKLMFPSSPPIKVTAVKKRYDFTFFANGLTKNKGIEDALHGFEFVRKVHPEATFNIIGDCDTEYMTYLKELMNKLGITEKVTIHGHFPSKEDALREVLKAKIAVLPSITASFNSTVRETMYMGIPTVVYDNAVIRNINRKEKYLLVAAMEDPIDLGKQMLFAYEHPYDIAALADRARGYAEKNFSVNSVGNMLVTTLKAITNNYYNKSIIQENLLLEYK